MSQAALPHTPPAFERLMLFDGVCVFCDQSVRWLMQRDPEGLLKFAPLQGSTAEALRARHPEIPHDIDTMVLIEAGPDGERVSMRSQAAVRALSLLPDPPGWLPFVRAIPRPLADLGYRIFAALRYRVFGKRDSCRIPSERERARFLD